LTGYGYLTVEPLEKLWLTGGLAYDDITFPRNFRQPPISSGEDHRSQLGPKAAVVWNPLREATLRGAYSRSLGGVSLDESFRLEPTQLAGFPQAFRSLIPESLVGSVSVPEYETFGLALDLKFPTRTYAGVQATRLNSEVNRSFGYFVASSTNPSYVTASSPELLNFREDSIGGSINQLLDDYFVLGAAYVYSQVELHDQLSQIPTTHQTQQAGLQQASAYVLFNHPSGFYARAEALWFKQINSGYATALPGDDFFQENLYLGYRFVRRRVDLTFGILNLSGQDYHLNPLNLYAELPRERVFMGRLNFQF
jgi:outer membrane receptor protein involved in Fe transport